MHQPSRLLFNKLMPPPYQHSELLGSSLGGVSTTESDMMHRYLMSTELVEKINTKINLRELYSKPKHDVVWIDSKGSNEDLLCLLAADDQVIL